MATITDEGRLLLDETELRKFYSLCIVDLVTGCWNWTGPTNQHSGCGVFNLKLDGKWVAREAYVVSYNHFVGVVPTGFELSHYNLSDGTSDKCAFWEHVRPITHAENIREARLHGTCKYGHDVARWGRTNHGACKVCQRVRNAGAYKHIYCGRCGYNPCRCNEANTTRR